MALDGTTATQGWLTADGSQVGTKLFAVLWWLCLAGPSVYVVQRFFGWGAVVAHLVLAAVLLRPVLALPKWLTDRQVRAALLAALALAVVVFAVAYPKVNVHEPGAGSDNDDTCDIGARALLHGESPYAHVTYLGNPLSLMPGSFVIAAPFTMAGASAIQNVFFLALFAIAVRAETRDERRALAVTLAVLAFSLSTWHSLVTGSDHMANPLYVLLGLWWLVRTERRDLAAVAWGITLASRANFLFLIPLAWGWLAARSSRTAATRTMLIALATFTAITLPFYLHAPDQFGPRIGAVQLGRLNALLPHADLIIMAAVGAASVVLARRIRTVSSLFGRCAIVQGIAPIGGLAISTAAGAPYLPYFAYAEMAAWFGLFALAIASAPGAEPRRSGL